jgi:hypothetical protein
MHHGCRHWYAGLASVHHVPAHNIRMKQHGVSRACTGLLFSELCITLFHVPRPGLQLMMGQHQVNTRVATAVCVGRNCTPDSPLAAAHPADSSEYAEGEVLDNSSLESTACRKRTRV